MIKTHLRIGFAVMLAILLSIVLIPDKSQLEFLRKKHAEKSEDETSQAAAASRQAAYEAAVAAGNLDAATANALADLYIANDQPEKAAALLERYRAENPNDIETLNKLGVLYHTLGRLDKYEEVLEQEYTIRPSLNILHILLDLYGTAEPQKSIKALREYLTMDPDNVGRYGHLIYFLQVTHQDAAMAEAIEKLKSIHPEVIAYRLEYPLVDELIKEKKYNQAYNEAVSWVKNALEPGVRDFSTMFLNAGRPDFAAKLLAWDKAGIENDPELFLLYVKSTLATDPKQAAKVAGAWMTRHPQDMKMLADLADIFFTSKRYQETAQLLSPFKDQPGFNWKLQNSYRESLSAGLSTHPENVPELARLLAQELNKPDTPPGRRRQILYALMNMGAWETALRYARAYAFQQRMDWVFLYEGFLKKLGRQKELNEFRLTYVHTEQLTPVENRYYTYAFLDQGNTAEAERLLLQAAENAPPDDQSVKTLLFIWGVEPEPGQLDWLENRALKASGAEKLKWMQILADARAYGRFIKVINTIPPQSRPLPMVQLYYGILQRMGEKEMLKAEVKESIDGESAEDRLAFFSHYALDQGFNDLALAGYDKLLRIHPGYGEYLENHGLAAYAAGDKKTAAADLKRYYDQGGRTPKAIFYRAEMLTDQHEDKEAAPLYQELLAILQKNPKPTSEERAFKVRSLTRLHRSGEADSEMQAMLKDNPDNPYLKLDYAELLIDNKQYPKAKAVLIPANFTVPKPPAAVENPSFQIPRAHISAVRHTIYAYELLLVYDRPIGKLPEAKYLVAHHPQWIVAAYPGYDKVLLIAKPENQFVFSYSASDITIAVRPVSSDGNAADTRRALAIRRELLLARLEQESGNRDAALSRLHQVNQDYPGDVSVLTTLAQAERDDGHRLAALDLAQQAYEADPKNAWVGTLLADLQRDDKPFIKLDNEWIHMTDNSQFDSELSAGMPVSRNFKLGVAVDNNFYSFKNLVLANGNVGGANGTAQTERIDGAYEFESGPIANTSIYFSPGTVGGGEKVAFRDALGTASVYGEYNRPDWTFTERIPDDATHNRMGVTQNWSSASGIYAYGGSSYSQYSQDNKNDATTSISLSGGVNVPVSLFDADWKGVPVSVGYALDAEYVLSQDYAVNSQGYRYLLYPLVSREVHSVNANYRYDFADGAFASVYVSYAYDRIEGFSGPSIGGVYTKPWADGLELQLRAGEGISITQMGSGVTTAGGYLLWRF